METDHLDLIWKDFEESLRGCDASNEYHDNSEIQFTCCGKSDFIEDTLGYHICSECGVVFDNTVISDKQNIYSGSENGSGIQKNETYHTTVDPLFPTYSSLTFIASKEAWTKRHLYMSNISTKEKNLKDIKDRLGEVVILYKLPPCLIQNCLYIYKDLQELEDRNKSIYHRGDIKEGLLAVCLYYSCKKLGINPLISFVIDIFKIDKKTFNKCCKIFSNILDDTEYKGVLTINDLLTSLCNTLNIDYKYQKLVKNLNRGIEKLELLDSFSSQSVSPSIIYFINIELGLNMDIDYICQKSYSCKSTILKIYKIINLHKNAIFRVVKSCE